MWQDLTTQWPSTVNNYAQTAPPPMITGGMTPRPQCPPITCDRKRGEPLYDIFTGHKAGGGGDGSSRGRSRTQDSRVRTIAFLLLM